MASDFEQFMNRMLGQAMPQAPQVPVAPTPQPMMPTPQAPAQSAYSSPMPAQLAQLIERAAQMAQAQRPAPQTDNQFYTQALQSQGVDPRATASTAPVQGPTAPVTQPTAASQPARQAEPAGYLLVQLQPQEGDQGMQGQMVLVPMGTGYKVPDSVTVVGNGDLITDPVGIERAREGGMLLEQQAPEVQAQFTTANEQTQFRGDAATNAERERINRGEIANAQAIQDRSAFDDAEPVEVFTTEQLKNSGVPELVQLGTQLEASGYTEYSTDQDVMVDPSSGKITLQPKEQEAPVEGPPAPEGEPVGTPLEALTPQKIRDMEGQTMFAEGTMSPTLVANEMQRQKITEVADGTMLVVDAEGNLSTPAASETAPQGSTIILYGGESTRPDPSILGSPMEAVTAVGDVLDASRRKAVELTSGALTSKPVEWWVENVTSPVWNALLSDEAVEHFMTEVYPTITAPIAPLALQSWIQRNPEKVAEVEQNGWDADDDGEADYTGNEAIWEAFIDEQPAWARVLYDLEMDPLNWATGGGNVARIGARELLTNPNVTRRVSGEALDIVGRILRSPDVAVDKIIQGTGLAIKNTLGTVPIVKLTLDTLTSPTVQSAVSRATRPVQQATEDVMKFLRDAEGGLPPAGTTPTEGPTPPPIGTRPPTDPRSPTGGTINDILNQVQQETDRATSGTAPRSATRDPLADIEGAAEQAGVPGPPEELFPRRTPREATDLPGDNPLIRTQNAADQAALDVTREQQGPRTIADMIREASEFGQRQAPGGPSVADPFEGTTLGETIQQAAEEAAVPQRPDWEFASPQDGAGRMVDEVFAQRQAHAREVAEFTRVHDPKARRFLEDQRAKRQRSMDTKAERGGQWDREHSRQEVIDEGRYIVDEFIPDFQATMRGTDVQLPEYKFRQEPIGNKNLQNQTDEYLLEQLAFGPDRYTRGIRNILRNRIGTKGDATLQRYWDEAEAIRTKNQNLRSGMGQTPLPEQAVPEAAPAPTAPAADDVWDDVPTDVPTIPVPTAPVRPGGRRRPGDIPTPQESAPVPTDRRTANIVDDTEPLPPRPPDTVRLVHVTAPELADEIASTGLDYSNQGMISSTASIYGPNDEVSLWSGDPRFSQKNSVAVIMDIPVDDLRLHNHLTNHPGRIPRDQITAFVRKTSDYEAPTPTTPVSRERARAESRYQRLPIAEVRETTEMTDEALEAVGLFPSQFRRQKFSEQTADSVFKRKRVNMPPVQVMRGTDGELYVLDGHSRLEGLRRRGDTDVDVQIVEGTREELEEAAKTTNLSTTTHGPMGYADRARELADEGMSYDEIARELRQGNENWGKAGKQKAVDYHSAAFLPEDLATMFDQGTIPLNQAGELGRAIQDDVMTPAELQSFYTNVVVPEKLTAVDIRGEIARAAERKAGNNITGQRNALGFTDEELGSSGFWQGRAEEARIHKLIRKEEQNVRKWDERAKRPGTKLSASQKVDRQQSINRIAELRRELEPAPVESVAPALPPTPDDILSPQGPSDVMRDSGAQPLFFQNDPKRGARNMFERTPGPLKVLTKPAPRRSGAPQAPNRFVARDESALSTTEFSGVQIGQHNWRILNERFANGDTYGDRWLKHVADVKDEQVARQADLSADAAKGAELTDAEAFEKAAGRVTHEVAVETLRDKSPKAFKAYQDEFTRLTTRKKDPIKDEWVARLRAFNHATANDSWWITRKYDYLLGMIREVILNNPITVGRYGLVNMLGNSVSAMLNDQPEIIGRALSRENVGSALRESAPNEFVTTLVNDPSSVVTRMFKYGHAQVDEPMTVDGVMSTIKDMGELPSVALHSPTESFAARMELGPQRHGVNTILRDQTTESVENPTKWANMVDSMRLGRHKVTPGTGGKLTGWIATRNGRDLANAMDVSFRTATWQSTMAANVAEGRTAFRDLMLQDLPRGADQARFNQLWDQLPAEFGPTRIREDFAEFGTNYADRMARDWTNAIGKMDENAREQVRRIFFSGDLTTADAYASRLILFHFWASRATPMYMKQLASHPGYLNAYIKLMENLEEQAQSGQYGKSVDGLMWLMKTPLGFNLFGRPDALFQTILSFGTQGNDFSPEGESGVAAWMRNSGLYFNPLIDFAFNMAGYQGDTFAPDPLALYNQRNLVITAWDMAKAHGWVEGDMPTPDMQAEFLTWMRSHTSGMLPGTTNIPDTDTTLYAQQQINYLIQDVAEERGLDPVGPEAVAAMNDPESELYQEAFRRYADAGGLRLALKILPTSVLYPRLRIARPDEIRYELTDPNITEERKDELYDQRAAARAGSNESRNLEVQQDEYYDLGTPEQQEAYSTYEDIRQGTLSEPVTINGVRINGRVLEDLSDDERSNAADLWASQNGQTENVQAIRDERKAYRESHPEYDGFVKWRSDVYDNPDGVLAWWQDTVEGNPNAERWLESLEPLPQDELTRELTSIEAYMQWAGIRPTTYDADPLATRDMSSVPYSATEGSGSGDGGQQWSNEPADPVEKINGQLTGYQEDMALYESQVAAVFGQPVSMQNLPPNVRSSYEMILADHGIRPPSLGTEAGDYIRWRNAQRPGTDTSVNAYVNWQQQWMGNTNAIPATTTTTTPP